MNVLVLKGSPRKKSDTFPFAAAFVEGMQTQGDIDVEIIDVIKKDIHPCRGCFGCWSTNEIRCVQNDDMADILPKIVHADVVIWSFPLYCFGMPSHLKAFMDRMLPLDKLVMIKDDEGSFSHGSKTKAQARHVAISGCGFPSPDGSLFEAVERQFEFMFPSRVTFLPIAETPLIGLTDAPDSFRQAMSARLADLKEAGSEYYRTGAVAAETKEAIGRLMVPMDDYLAIVNEHAAKIEQKQSAK